MVKSVHFNTEKQCLELLDQTLLPGTVKTVICNSEHEVARAIVTMQVRGAPAIGVAAAYGIYLGLKRQENQAKPLEAALKSICDLLAATRPTAVNLFWAIERVKKLVQNHAGGDFAKATALALTEADKILAEDIAMCKEIGRHGATLLKDGQTWLTHCNAGALATGGYGTALGVFRAAREAGKNFRVFVDETRPLLQGSRLTAWELLEEGIDATLICDNMAGSLLRDDKVQGVVVGADRITAKGFVANKIGTYPLAVLAKYNGVPFYVAAPDSTFDLSLNYGDEIKIEERDHNELRFVGDQQIAPVNMPVFNPAFDVTPPELITAIITNKGIIRPIYGDTIPEIIQQSEKN